MEQTETRISRRNLLNAKGFRESLEELLGSEYISEDKALNIPVILINRSRILDIAQFMKDWKFSLDNIFITDNIDHFELNYLFSNLQFLNNSKIIIQCQNDKEVNPPSLSHLFPNAINQEINNYKRLGIEFTKKERQLDKNNEDLKNKITKRQHFVSPTEIVVQSINDNPLPYGVFHPIHTDKHYIHTYTKTNIIKDVELKDGWLYKKIQPQLEQCNPFNVSSIFDQISEYDNVALNLAYFNNLEYLYELKNENKIKYVRTLLAELERITNHVIWLVNLSNLLDNNLAGIKLYKEYSNLSKHIKRCFNSVQLFNTIKFNSSIDTSLENFKDFWRYLYNNQNKLFNLAYDVVYNKHTQTILTDLGRLSKKDAINFGVTGPALRGSGVPIDIRKTTPNLSYLTGELSQEWSVITFNNGEGGDCFTRAQVRLWELHESINLAKFILNNLSNYPHKIKINPLPEEKISLLSNKNVYNEVESPNGRLGIYLRTDLKETTDKFYTVRILTPDAANFPILKKILIGEQQKYIPLIVHSLNLNFHMIDL